MKLNFIHKYKRFVTYWKYEKVQVSNNNIMQIMNNRENKEYISELRLERFSYKRKSHL